ncbi:hypothetical protein GGX14DRAFT_587731 [Mycena pura]|uniref:Uncharacterized protein n=1 Tax=Mycena pura TaxID=153505 RepID=A0AAD6Y6Q9_9AGAR|nr:hypothetical protein GGX14DRAFT_587731 [Mycena pura]
MAFSSYNNTHPPLATPASCPLGAGAPQWAVDMFNTLDHHQRWDSYVHKISIHNLEVGLKEKAEWDLARSANSGLPRDARILAPLPTPFARLAVPAIPAPPAPGAAVNLPPPFAPPPIAVPPADPLFPATIADLRHLPGEHLDVLLASYGCQGQNLPIDQKRALFARLIGVSL